MNDVPTSEHPASTPEIPSSGERRGDEGRRPPRGGPRSDRPKKRDVSGWVILDKGVGMTSTHAVAVVKRAFNAKKAGMPAPSIRWPPASCRSRWARPPRPFPS